MGDIHFASIDDVDDIMDFIHRHWKKNHILSRNKDFFLYHKYYPLEKLITTLSFLLGLYFSIPVQ